MAKVIPCVTRHVVCLCNLNGDLMSFPGNMAPRRALPVSESRQAWPGATTDAFRHVDCERARRTGSLDLHLLTVLQPNTIGELHDDEVHRSLADRNHRGVPGPGAVRYSLSSGRHECPKLSEVREATSG